MPTGYMPTDFWHLNELRARLAGYVSSSWAPGLRRRERLAEYRRVMAIGARWIRFECLDRHVWAVLWRPAEELPDCPTCHESDPLDRAASMGLPLVDMDVRGP